MSVETERFLECDVRDGVRTRVADIADILGEVEVEGRLVLVSQVGLESVEQGHLNCL